MKVLRLLLSHIGPTRLAQTDQAVGDNGAVAPCKLSRRRAAPIVTCDARHLCYFPSCTTPGNQARTSVRSPSVIGRH